MLTGKNLYVRILILCCVGYQTDDNSELQTVILWSMMVLLHFATLKCSFKITLFSSFLTIKTCQFLITTHIYNYRTKVFNIYMRVSEKWTLIYLPSFSVRFRVFNATFNNIPVISWRSVLLVDEIGVPRGNHRPATDHWQTWSHNVVSNTSHHERDSNPQL
jgi:hypothetical protein